MAKGSGPATPAEKAELAHLVKRLTGSGGSGYKITGLSEQQRQWLRDKGARLTIEDLRLIKKEASRSMSVWLLQEQTLGVSGGLVYPK